MIRFVVDASIILTWCFPDEETQKAEETSERIALGARVVVPAFWPREILNALLMCEKRKRLTPELTQAFIADLSRLPVDLDVATVRTSSSMTSSRSVENIGSLLTTPPI